MQVTRCDRCHLVGQSSTQVLGFDLCAECGAALQVWVKAGTGRAHAKELVRHVPPRGQLLRIARELIERDGCVTEASFAQVTGLTGRKPYYQLAYLRRMGWLESDTAPGRAVFFVLAESRQAAE